MAVVSAILVFSGEPCQNATIGAAASTGEIVLGKNAIFAINATADINIKFGNAGMAAAAATDYRIPANQQTTLDTSDTFDRIRVFSTPGGNLSVQKLSRF